MKKCRLELLLYEILHLRESLVGSLAFFILVLNQGGPVNKNNLVSCIVSISSGSEFSHHSAELKIMKKKLLATL